MSIMKVNKMTSFIMVLRYIGRSTSGLLLLIFFFLVNDATFAQQVGNARGGGTAFSNAADTYGLQNVGLNPAGLARKSSFNFEINLISGYLMARNNSFTKSQYDKYLTTGDLLTGQDKEDILASIDNDNIRADLLGRLNTLAFATRYFSISVIGKIDAALRIPSDVLDLTLNGNNGDGRAYRLADSKGVNWAGAGVLVSGAVPLIDRQQGDGIRFLALGATVKYISGGAYRELVRADAEMIDFGPESPGVQLVGEFDVLASDGGRGLGLDLGFLMDVGDRFSAGIAVLNPISSITWDKNNERRIWAIDQDSLSFPGLVNDSLFADTDTTFATDDFSTKLPLIVDLAFAYRPTEKFVVTAEYEQGLNSDMGGTRRSRVAMGMEYRAIPVLPLRTGVTIGGRSGIALALGAGINLKYWYLDFAYMNHGQLVPNDFKGVTLALTSRLRF